jgi:hypothetical protein
MIEESTMETVQQRADGTGKLSLARKLAEVMGAVNHVPKNGSNNFHNYKYATEADIVAAVRKEMASRLLIMIPSVVKTEWSKVARRQGGEDRLCTLTMKFTIHDGDSGEEMSFDMVGEGQDPGDKAVYKAETGATKYALLKLFLIPTGDDPEHDEKGDEDERPQGKGQRKGRKPVEESSPRDSPPHPAPKPEATGLTVGFGPYKKAPIGDVSDDGINESIDFAEAKLLEEPSADWAPAMRQKLALLKSEKARRAATPKKT